MPTVYVCVRDLPNYARNRARESPDERVLVGSTETMAVIPPCDLFVDCGSLADFIVSSTDTAAVPPSPPLPVPPPGPVIPVAPDTVETEVQTLLNRATPSTVASITALMKQLEAATANESLLT